MAKKKKKKKRSAKGKSGAFSGFKQHKKTLKAPIPAAFEGHESKLSVSSWHNVQMPEFLWVALILNEFETDNAIERLRRIAQSWPNISELENRKVQPGSLSAIAGLNGTARAAILDTILQVVESKSIIAPLCNLTQLPSRSDWVARFGEEESIEHWKTLGRTVENFSRFQGELATHTCWFISLVGAVSGQMTAAEHLRQGLDEMRSSYPANMKLVGGLFRSEAGTMREWPTGWPEMFWNEVYDKFPCSPARSGREQPEDYPAIVACAIGSVAIAVSDHYWTSRNRSDDRIHETAFGIALAAAALANEVIELRSHTRFSGLASLRTITECAINLSFLVQKNEPDLWARFRLYGSGQAHLISTKLNNDLASANCVDSLWIEAFLQEEQSKDFINIELGDWSGDNLRSRAEESGTKDLYDSYYDYSSSLLHGDWLGAATFGTTWDMNPFHRLQRVPREYPRNIPSVIPDLARVLNRMLDTLDSLYPGLTFRLQEPQLPEDGEAENE
ncbi:MAG: hypothetical protein DWQ31_08700 [Planctomycetota bacterium]|nr:MAG: hypothetical protein DWQ31_08700 [Planctomycetota bacterium]REJ86931.1 MAG: hypothetical protein DWQ35_22470 [Planctomycetota bacterium]REK24942.1 MAG: hypothetical protein DWQ42_12700 [Planctomycetota bacterium]REK48531.1 MAG: hypothetical protein DWQ46_02230 [Planctomycetota bacterium]